MKITFTEILDNLLKFENNIPAQIEKDWFPFEEKSKIKELSELNLISLEETTDLFLITCLTENGINLLEKVRNENIRQNILEISNTLKIKEFSTFLQVVDIVFSEYIKKNIN